jgi:hypothetical protein
LFDDVVDNGDQTSSSGIQATSIQGRLYVYPGNDSDNVIYVGDTADHKLLLTYNSSSSSGIIEFTSLNGWHYVESDGTVGGLISDGDNPTEIPASGACYDFSLSGLKSGTTYTITLEGCMSQISSAKTQIGTTTVKTAID